MIKTLLKSVRDYKVPSILCPIVMVGEAAMEIVIPYLMTFIIGELQNLSEIVDYTVNYNKIIICSVLMVVCALFALFCGVWGGKLAARTCTIKFKNTPLKISISFQPQA